MLVTTAAEPHRRIRPTRYDRGGRSKTTRLRPSPPFQTMHSCTILRSIWALSTTSVRPTQLIATTSNQPTSTMSKRLPTVTRRRERALRRRERGWLLGGGSERSNGRAPKPACRLPSQERSSALWLGKRGCAVGRAGGGGVSLVGYETARRSTFSKARMISLSRGEEPSTKSRPESIKPNEMSSSTLRQARS